LFDSDSTNDRVLSRAAHCQEYHYQAQQACIAAWLLAYGKIGDGKMADPDKPVEADLWPPNFVLTTAKRRAHDRSATPTTSSPKRRKWLFMIFVINVIHFLENSLIHA